MHPFRMRWTVHSGAILLRWTTHSIYNGIGTFLFLADHLVSIEFNKSGPWQTDPFSHLLFKADIIGNHLVSNPTLLAGGLTSIKPCSRVTSPFAFASNVKNAFYDKQVMLFILDVCIFKNLTWKIKEQESIPVGCVPSAFLVGGGGLPNHFPPLADPSPDADIPWMLVMWPVMHAGIPAPHLDRRTPLKTLPFACGRQKCKRKRYVWIDLNVLIVSGRILIMSINQNDVYVLLLLWLLQLDNSLLLERVADTRPAQQATMYSMMDQLMEDDFSMDFTDTLFTTLNQQGFQFPNPKEMCKKHATSK